MLCNLFSRSPSRRQARRSAARALNRRPGHFPRLEALEDRAVPSTFTVRTLADGGAGSLRAALLAANSAPGADTVVFAPAVRGTIALKAGELSVTDALTIAGPGADLLTVSGNLASRFLGNKALGVAGAGAGIATPGELEGGAVYNFGGELTVRDSLFEENEAVGGTHDAGAVLADTTGGRCSASWVC